MSTDTKDRAQERLLDAAEELFGKNGFEGTSVRELTKEAKCNIAAVNYHFGGKDKLYNEVFRQRMSALRDIRIASIKEGMSSGEKATLENLLRAFATAFIEPVLDESGGRRFIKLMTREMVDRRLPQTMFMDIMVRPVFSALQEALMKICPALDSKNAVFSIHSYIAQLVHVIRMSEFLIEGENVDHPIFNLSVMIENIVNFSAAGIHGLLKGEGR